MSADLRNESSPDIGLNVTGLDITSHTVQVMSH